MLHGRPPHLNLTMTSIKLGFIAFILQMRTPKLREVKSFAGGHTAVSPVEPGFKPVLPGYKVHTLNFPTNLLLHEMCRVMPILQVRRLVLKRVKAIAKKPKRRARLQTRGSSLALPCRSVF